MTLTLPQYMEILRGQISITALYAGMLGYRPDAEKAAHYRGQRFAHAQ